MNWSNEGKEFQQAPCGTHVARCIKIIDIGTQTGEYKGQPTAARKNVVFWELPFELNEDEKPFIVSKFYTASLGEKANLRKDLINWRGRDFTVDELRAFDPKNILDKPCQVTITKNEKGKHVVTGISGTPKGIQVPDRFNDLVFFMLDDFEQEKYDKLSEGVKKMIRACAEYDSLGVIESSEAAHTGGSAANLNSAADYSERVRTAAQAAGQGNGLGGNDFSNPTDDEIPF